MRKLGQVGCAVILLFIALAVAASMASPKREATITSPGSGTAATAAPAGATKTPTPQAKVNDTVRFGNWEYTVTKIERVKTIQWSEFGNKTDAIGEWLVVSLTLKNIGDRNFPINDHDFHVTAAGVKYDPTTKFEAYSFVSYVKLRHLGEQFPPGLPVNTAILFDLAPGTKDLKLVLEQANGTTIALD